MRVQRVTAPDGGTESWTVVDEAFAVVDPVDEFLAHPTVAGLARAAGIARSWIYAQPDLLARITTERPDTRPAATAHPRSSDESWRRRIELAHQRIKQYPKRTGNCETNLQSHTVNAEPNKSPRRRHGP